METLISQTQALNLDKAEKQKKIKYVLEGDKKAGSETKYIKYAIATSESEIAEAEAYK